MNEQDAYKTVIKNQIVNDDQIKRTARTAVPEHKLALRILKPVGVALAALLFVFGVAMAIPSARAEVMRWFTPTSAREYMTQDPEERVPNEELDALIVPGEQNETHVEVHETADDEIFPEIAQALETVELGDTMFDGQLLYVRLKVNGIGMLSEIESMTGGNLTKTLIPPELTSGYFEDNKTPKEFLSGEVPFWAESEVLATITFADGTRYYGGWFETSYTDIQPLLDSLRHDGLDQGWYTTPEQYAVINERELAYLRERTVNTTMMLYPSYYWLSAGDPSNTLLDEFHARADENGLVTMTIGMQVVQDFGDGTAVAALDATLGEVTVDLDAYKSLKKTELKPDGSQAVFAPKQTFFTSFNWEDDEKGIPYAVYTNTPIDLDGMALKPLNGAYIDALGIQNLRIELTPPKGVEQESLEQLDSMFLSFEVWINGQKLGYADDERMEITENGTVTITIGRISGVPLDELNDIKTVTLIPYLSYVRFRRVYNESGETLSDLELQPGIPFVDKDGSETFVGETTEYPQYAITFAID